MKMDSEIAFVKEQLLAQDKMITKYQEQPHRVALHLQTKSRFEALLGKLVAIQENSGPSGGAATLGHVRPVNKLEGIHLTLVDIEDAPQELLNELNISESDRQEMIILDIIVEFGGIASLAKIIASLYQRTGVIVKRNTMVSKLFRMADKHMIFNVPGKRGIYSSYEMNEDEAERLFGKTTSEAAEGDAETRDETQETVNKAIVVTPRPTTRPLFRRSEP